MYTIDLHTHSLASRDGGITVSQYTKLIKNGVLDFIAVTDHNKIDFALELQKTLGEHIIVGEEINTLEGEIIGLYLREAIPRDLPAQTAARAIKDQGGLVYIPHPFETVRHGLSETSLSELIALVDIIEIFNGRAFFQNRGPHATTFARLHNKPGAASSDAHGIKGIGTVFSQISKSPSAKNLPELLQTAHYVTKRPPLRTLLYPKANRIRKGWARD